MEYWELEWGYTNVHTQNKKRNDSKYSNSHVNEWNEKKERKPEKAYS